MAHTPRTVHFNVQNERIIPGYSQVVIQFSIINLKIALEIEISSTHLKSLPVINAQLFQPPASEIQGAAVPSTEFFEQVL